MQKSSFLSQQQTDQLLKQCICNNTDLQQLIKQKITSNTNITQSTIIKSLLVRVRYFVLQLQKSLGIAHKIKQLKIYDHDSEVLFLPILMNLNKIIPENARQVFVQLYKNSRLKSIEIIWLTQYNFVYSDQKYELYTAFLQFAQKHDLFTKARLQQKDPTQGSIPYQTVDKVFPKRDLQLIYKIFKQSNYNVLKTYTNLKKYNLQSFQYASQKQFVYRFDNILLIGVYQIYKEIYLKQEEANTQNWEIFKAFKFRNVNFSQHLNMLFRVAIRKDPTLQEINTVKQIIQKKSFYANYSRLHSQKKQDYKKHVQNKKYNKQP